MGISEIENMRLSKRFAPQLEDSAIIDITTEAPIVPLNASAPEFLPGISLDTPNQANSVKAPTMAPIIKFPNNSIRQRSSNITLDDPEKEFNKTALDTCRGTIVTQEAELKKLKEGMEIRNKKIMQLEDQVSHASTYIASRNPPEVGYSIPINSNTTSSHAPELQHALNSIASKLESLSSPPASNIHINNNHSWNSLKTVQSLDKSTQACSPPLVSEYACKTLTDTTDTDTHMEA